jgi:hypothetical protein
MKKTKDLSADDCILVDALARTDALFAPWRDHSTAGPHAAGSIWRRRTAFPDDGVEVFSKEAAARDRMAFSRRVAGLVEGGRVVACRARGRTVGIRLTSAGDEWARSICALPAMDECLDKLDEMAGDDGWVRETALAGREYDGSDQTKDAVFELQLVFAPALWRSLVEARSDWYRRVAYRLTAAGAVAMDNDVDHDPQDAPEINRAAVKRYFSIRAAEIEARKRWDDPDVGFELGDLPLPAMTAGDVHTTTNPQD